MSDDQNKNNPDMQDDDFLDDDLFDDEFGDDLGELGDDLGDFDLDEGDFSDEDFGTEDFGDDGNFGDENFDEGDVGAYDEEFAGDDAPDEAVPLSEDEQALKDKKRKQFNMMVIGGAVFVGLSVVVMMAGGGGDSTSQPSPAQQQAAQQQAQQQGQQQAAQQQQPQQQAAPMTQRDLIYGRKNQPRSGQDNLSLAAQEQQVGMLQDPSLLGDVEVESGKETGLTEDYFDTLPEVDVETVDADPPAMNDGEKLSDNEEDEDPSYEDILTPMPTLDDAANDDGLFSSDTGDTGTGLLQSSDPATDSGTGIDMTQPAPQLETSDPIPDAGMVQLGQKMDLLFERLDMMESDIKSLKSSQSEVMDIVATGPERDTGKSTVNSAEIQAINLTLKALEKRLNKIEDGGVKVVSQPAPRKQAAQPVRRTPVVPPKPPKMPDVKTPKPEPLWELRGAQSDSAFVARKDGSEMRLVEIGDQLDGIGVVTNIAVLDGRWIVQGTNGTLSQ